MRMWFVKLYTPNEWKTGLIATGTNEQMNADDLEN